MALILGKKTIKRRIKFDAKGDEGDIVPSSFAIEIERPTKAVAKEFSLLFAKFIDLLGDNEKAADDKKVSLVDFTKNMNDVEQELSDFVKDRISNWYDVMTPEQEPLAFDQESLELLFGDQESRRAVFVDYKELVTGHKEQAEKNSKKQVEAG